MSILPKSLDGLTTMVVKGNPISAGGWGRKVPTMKDIDTFTKALMSNATIKTIQFENVQPNDLMFLGLVHALNNNQTAENLSLINAGLTEDKLVNLLFLNKSLKTVDVSRNNISGVDKLIPVLQMNTTLEKLVLSGNRLSPEEITKLEEAMPSLIIDTDGQLAKIESFASSSLNLVF